MQKVSLNDFEIGGDKTFIIADIGSNHKQDLELAKDSISAAIEAGANAVKFQSIQLNELYLKPDIKTTTFIKQLEFPEAWHFILKDYCDKQNIIFFSSPTYMKAVDLLEEINVSLYKLASAQIGTFPQIVEKVASLQKPTIFSTGIAAYDEIIKTVAIFKKYKNDKFIILHCNSIYPTPAEETNLQLMNTYKQMFGNPVGFSDHTEGTHIACAAVAMGAKVIEKHFVLNRNLKTPDSTLFASDPYEFKSLVIKIREIEQACHLFYDRLQILPDELNFKEDISYRVVAKENININEILKEQHLQYLRAPDGINCKDTHSILGKAAQRKIQTGEIIKYEDIK